MLSITALAAVRPPLACAATVCSSSRTCACAPALAAPPPQLRGALAARLAGGGCSASARRLSLARQAVATAAEVDKLLDADEPVRRLALAVSRARDSLARHLARHLTHRPRSCTRPKSARATPRAPPPSPPACAWKTWPRFAASRLTPPTLSHPSPHTRRASRAWTSSRTSPGR